MVLRRLFESEQKLYNTGAFDQVHIRPVGSPDTDNAQLVIVGVREGRSRLLNFGLGFREYEGPR
jgi:outer membrane protein assembly factor BamA